MCKVIAGRSHLQHRMWPGLQHTALAKWKGLNKLLSVSQSLTSRGWCPCLNVKPAQQLSNATHCARDSFPPNFLPPICLLPPPLRQDSAMVARVAVAWKTFLAPPLDTPPLMRFLPMLPPPPSCVFLRFPPPPPPPPPSGVFLRFPRPPPPRDKRVRPCGGLRKVDLHKCSCMGRAGVGLGVAGCHATGVWKLSISFPPEYPFVPPRIVFDTPSAKYLIPQHAMKLLTDFAHDSCSQSITRTFTRLRVRSSWTF